jgi:cytochrome c553
MAIARWLPWQLLGLPVCFLSYGAAIADRLPPAWAYPLNSPPVSSDQKADTPRYVPNSSAVYTNREVGDLFLSPDWHPEEHPAAPSVITRGRAPDVYACGCCHRITGSGGPENAKIAGLPYGYIVQQLESFRMGTRSTSLPERVPQAFMISSAKALTSDEIHETAAYFSRLTPMENIRVVEAATVPKTHGASWRLVADKGGEPQRIGVRIVELPDRVELFESRDSRATFTAYVPPGSIVRGKLLAEASRHSAPCVSCHGPQLRGTDLIPPLAGRSPTYLVRQLFDIQNGARAGPQLNSMKAAVLHLKIDDMIALAAYAASLKGH